MIGSTICPSHKLIAIFGIFVLGLLFTACNKTECTGCYEDTPWSTVSSTDCYPTESACEAANPTEECVKCTD